MIPSNKKRRTKGAGSIVKRGKKYYLETTINGKRMQKSLRTENRQEAEKKAKELLPNLQVKTQEEVVVKVAEARRIGSKDKVMMNNAWQMFHDSPLRKQSTAIGTLGNYERNFNKFCYWLRDNYPSTLSLSMITLNIATEYATYLWKTGISGATYNYHIGSLETITNVLMRQAGIQENEWKHVERKPLHSVGKKRLFADDLQKIIEVFQDTSFKLMHKEQMKTIFHIGILTGMRLVDCVLLKWSHVDFEKGFISLIPTKTRGSRKKIKVPIHPFLHKCLMEAKEKWASDDYVLPDIAARYNYNPSGVRKDCIAVFQRAGFETTVEVEEHIQRQSNANQYGFHSLRHTFVSECASRGVLISVLSEMTGDKIQTLEKYYIEINESAIRNATQFIPGFDDPSQSERQS